VSESAASPGLRAGCGRAIESLAIGAVFASFVVVVLQLTAWIDRNGFSTTGECVNHFGEPYPCDLWSWIERGFISPFAWPAVAMIVIVVSGAAFGVLSFIAVRRARPRGARGE
jgi:hypothetical protein